EAVGALRWAMQVGVDPVPIADALAMAVRNLSRVAAERGGAAQLAGRLGMAAWQIDKARRQARTWTAEGLAEAMRVCAKLNGDVKGGADDRAWALEHAILEDARLSGSGGRVGGSRVGCASRPCEPASEAVVGQGAAAAVSVPLARVVRRVLRGGARTGSAHGAHGAGVLVGHAGAAANGGGDGEDQS